jgi:hypothetical protein
MVFRLTLGICLALLLSGCTCGEDAEDDKRLDGADTKLEAGVRTAKILFVEGNVRVKRAGSMEWLQALKNMELAMDDKLRTLRDSFATIEFDKGGVLKVGPETLVSVTDLRIEQQNRAVRSTFTLIEGNVEAELDALEKSESEFRIRTPSAETSVIKREVAFQ